MFSFFFCCKNKKNDSAKKAFALLQALRLNRAEDPEDAKWELRDLIQSGDISPNTRDEKGWTLFHRVVHTEAKLFNQRGKGKINRNSLTQACLYKDADVNAKTEDRASVTALQLVGKHEGLRDLLLANGASQYSFSK